MIIFYSRGADDIFGDFESAQPVAAQPQQAATATTSTTTEPGKKSNADILSLFSQAPPQQQFNQFQQQAPQQQMFGNFSQQQFSPQQQQPPGGSFDMLGLGKLTLVDLYFDILSIGNLGSPTSQQPPAQPPSQAAFMAANPFMAQGQNQFQGEFSAILNIL